MFQRAHVGRERMFGRFIGVLFLGIAALGFSLGFSASLFAQQSKGLYYGGRFHQFYRYVTGGLAYSRYSWDGSNATDLYDDDWPVDPYGNLGACVFNGQLYCFFTTQNGALQYVTESPYTGGPVSGPTTIVTGIQPYGTAAAVCGNTIYVFTGDQAFQSKDGKQFAVWPLSSGLPASRILDAVTFYPPGDLPAGIMVVFNDIGNPPNLSASRIYPPENIWYGGALPWPPVVPYLWQPVLHGNLLLGTSAGFQNFPAGAKAPCIQFYGMTDKGQDGQHQGRWEYNVANQAWSFNDITTTSEIEALFVSPWFDTMDSTRGTVRLSHILDYVFSNADHYYVNRSDWMAPQHNDAVYGWAGVPTPTANASGSDLQNLWTLVGVVLGPPPFPMNGATNACATASDALAWVDYGKDTSTTVTTTSTSSSTISVAMNNSIKAGIGELSLDLSYAHAWTSSHGTSQTVSVSQYYEFGPCSEQQGSQGTHGWAIFNAPTLITQWYKLYAYDYNQSTGQGTYLDQDIYATAMGAVVQQTAYFELANPSQGEPTGLFAGMTVYPNSTDVASWHLSIPNWDNGGSDWAAVFGDKTSPQMPVLNLGLRDLVSYAESDTTTGSKGNSNSLGVQAGAGLNILGFSTGVTVGYDGEWTTTTDNESTITQNVSCALNVPIPPNTPGYVNSMTVQPFWLQAKTTKAPWIPTGYGGNLPWCVTWGVTQYGTVGGGTAGISGPPASASGTIRHGKGMGKDTYSLSGGYLAWLNADGTEKTMPLTADEFDPSQGASVSLNGHVFSADETHGKWVRKGDVWKYRTRGGATTDSLTLELNFANRTWSFTGSSQTLDQEIHTADKQIRVTLDIQGTYRFATWLKHDVDTSWSHSEPESTWKPYGVHELEGAYNSQTGVGNLKLQGHIPRHVSSFGDLEIRVNGASVAIPLLPLEGFLHDLERGRSVKYKAQGLSFEINFRTGKWKATLTGDQFKGDMAPRSDAIRVQVLLGGRTISDQTFVIQRHTTVLSFNAR